MRFWLLRSVLYRSDSWCWSNIGSNWSLGHLASVGDKLCCRSIGNDRGHARISRAWSGESESSIAKFARVLFPRGSFRMELALETCLHSSHTGRWISRRRGDATLLCGCRNRELHGQPIGMSSGLSSGVGHGGGLFWCLPFPYCRLHHGD